MRKSSILYPMYDDRIDESSNDKGVDEISNEFRPLAYCSTDNSTCSFLTDSNKRKRRDKRVVKSASSMYEKERYVLPI